MHDILIKGIGSYATPALKQTAAPTPSAPFGDMLKGAVQETNNLLQEAEGSALKVVAGDTGSLHQAMIALEKADISFRALLQVRNKVLEAYQEIMRMQI
jgi:flagellar hook-basal body complex protein FliE